MRTYIGFYPNPTRRMSCQEDSVRAEDPGEDGHPLVAIVQIDEEAKSETVNPFSIPLREPMGKPSTSAPPIIPLAGRLNTKKQVNWGLETVW